jgi:hypothetical protein
MWDVRERAGHTRTRVHTHLTHGLPRVLTTVVRVPLPTWLVHMIRTPVLQEGGRRGERTSGSAR